MVTMQPNTVISSYTSLREAALAGRKQANVEFSAAPVDIMSAQVDRDLATTDTIKASYWNGDFSCGTAELTFQEVQRDGKQLLHFSAEKATDFTGSDVVKSEAMIDLASGQLLASSGAGEFFVGAAAQAAPAAQPSAEERQQQAIRQSYRDLSELAAQGQAQFSYGMQDVTVQERRPGYLSLQSWDGGFSSPQVTECYQEVQDGGKTLLDYTRRTPANPFLVGSEAETVHHRFPL